MKKKFHFPINFLIPKNSVFPTNHFVNFPRTKQTNERTAIISRKSERDQHDKNKYANTGNGKGRYYCSH